MIVEMTSPSAVEDAPLMPRAEVKWSRARRLAVALASAAGSWIAVIGAGYLIVQLF